MLVGETRGTVGRLTALPADGGAGADISPADTLWTAAALDASRTHVGFTSQAPDRAPEAFVADVREADVTPTREGTRGAPRGAWPPVQVSHVQELPNVALGRTEVVSWKAPDGKTIEGLLTYPVGYAAGARVPLLVDRPRRADGRVRALLHRRAVALSGGRVRRPRLRGAALQRRAAAAATAASSATPTTATGAAATIRTSCPAWTPSSRKGIADPERLGVMGWSYGGYMTSWVITQTKRFKAASVGAGVTNLMCFTGTADIPSFLPDYFGGEFWDVLRRLAHALRDVQRQGRDDADPHPARRGGPAVPISQGYELYNALKRQGVHDEDGRLPAPAARHPGAEAACWTP